MVYALFNVQGGGFFCDHGLSHVFSCSFHIYACAAFESFMGTLGCLMPCLLGTCNTQLVLVGGILSSQAEGPVKRGQLPLRTNFVFLFQQVKYADCVHDYQTHCCHLAIHLFSRTLRKPYINYIKIRVKMMIKLHKYPINQSWLPASQCYKNTWHH